MHQKSNKCTEHNFLMRDNKLQQSERGAGCYVVDCGMSYEGCLFRGNRLGGLVISGFSTARSQKSSLHLLEANKFKSMGEVESRLHLFIKKFPLCTRILNCEFTLNSSHGLWVDEHWKGPVFI